MNSMTCTLEVDETDSNWLLRLLLSSFINLLVLILLAEILSIT